MCFYQCVSVRLSVCLSSLGAWRVCEGGSLRKARFGPLLRRPFEKQVDEEGRVREERGAFEGGGGLF